MKPKILVTAALPYGNGHLHLGHLVEHIQTNIWVKNQKMLGRECISLCGDDAHGTPIMLKAEKQGMSPEALAAAMQKSHEEDFVAFGIDYDCYHSTHSPENEVLVALVYQKLEARGDIIKKTIEQAFDPIKKLFLPDRYVKGICPRCKAADQYGDNCEVCGATYAPTDLIAPVSVLSGATPIQKESLHYFFNLPAYTSMLKEWIQGNGHLQTEIMNKLSEWFEQGLKTWDISRDAPYFGFKIPGTEDKYFYVWLDAPIGYMAAFEKYSQEKGLSFAEFWGKESQTELYHFVGKDIVYFHALFWPAMLSGSGFRLPTSIFAHGFLTVDGQKMSKSRGTFIEAKTYLRHLNPEYLRYYFAAKLSSKVDDIDLNFADFMHKVNADLVGKFVNIASRCSGFIAKYSANQMADSLDDADLYAEILALRPKIIQAYLERDYAFALREIMDAAHKVNQYIDAKKPWVLAKDETRLSEVQAVASMGLNLFRLLMGYLKPVLPFMASQVETFLAIDALTWDNLAQPLLSHQIQAFSPLIFRVEQRQLDAMLAETSTLIASEEA